MGVNRRQFLQRAGMTGGALAAAAALPACKTVFPLGYEAKHNLLSHSAKHAAIDTIVIVMSENRSFDHWLGWLGADEAFNYRTDDWVALTKAATGGIGAQLILDMVGGDYIPRNLDALAVDGRLVQIAFLKSPKAEIDFSLIMRKRLWVTGSTLRPRTPAEKGEIAKALLAQVWPLLEQGRVKPIIHTVFPLSRAADAHRLMESSEHIGKIVLDVRSE